MTARPATVKQQRSRVPGEDDVGGPEALFLPVDDFFARCGERVEYILEPYLPKDGFVIVGGAPKSGKTWFLGWLACEIAADGKTVLFVEEEGSRETLKERLQPFKREGMRILVSHRKGWKLDDDRSLNRLIEEIKAAGAHVLILDPLLQLHAHSRQIGDVPAEAIQAIQRIIRETGCAVILAHHTRKGDSWNKSSSEEAQSADLAGSFAWAGTTDNIIQIKGVPNTDRRPGEVRFYVENPDTRNGEPFPRRLAVVKPGPWCEGAMTFEAPESTAAATLRELIPYVPVWPVAMPQTITAEELRKASGKGKLPCTAAIKLGEQTGVFRRKIGKGGGIYRPEDRGLSASASESRTEAPVRGAEQSTGFPNEK